MSERPLRTLVMPARGLEWQERALCAGGDPAVWFPDQGEAAREAKRICRMCPVRQPCLEYALGNNEKHGILGGCPSGNGAG